MFKVISIILVLLNLLNADILAIHKKIIPIALLQSTQVTYKASKNINFAIVVSKDEIIKGLSLKEQLPKDYRSYKLNINIIYEENLEKELFDKNKYYDGLYVFSVSKNNYQKIKEYSIKNSSLTFSNDYIGLQNGILFYIGLEDKIVIYINKDTMIKSKIKLDQRFLRMVKIFEN